MERRTMNWTQLFFGLAVFGVLITAPALEAASVLDPDEQYPVSRFSKSEGASEVNDWVGDRMPASQSLPASGQGTPLGKLRRNGVQEIALIAGDLGFFPRTVFVTRDIPVRLFVTGASKSSLCILMDSFQVRKQVRSQRIEEVSFTPTQPGKFRFYCPINGAEGFLVVREFDRGDGG
ncbi:MAG: cupredoxin domain-containing protein [Oligoflexia bacterium]